MKVEYCVYSPEFYKVTAVPSGVISYIYKIPSRLRFKENGAWFIHKTQVSSVIQLAILKDVDVSYDTIEPELRVKIDKLRTSWKNIFSEKKLKETLLDHDKEKWFGVLYLTPDAPMFIVKAVWRALASKLHPDAGGDVEVFKELTNAYEKVCEYAR